MGKTFLDPKKDSKWERGRTRRVMHFGAHVRGGKAVGAEVGVSMSVARRYVTVTKPPFVIVEVALEFSR